MGWWVSGGEWKGGGGIWKYKLQNLGIYTARIGRISCDSFEVCVARIGTLNCDGQSKRRISEMASIENISSDHWQYLAACTANIGHVNSKDRTGEQRKSQSAQRKLNILMANIEFSKCHHCEHTICFGLDSTVVSVKVHNPRANRFPGHFQCNLAWRVCLEWS